MNAESKLLEQYENLIPKEGYESILILEKLLIDKHSLEQDLIFELESELYLLSIRTNSLDFNRYPFIKENEFKIFFTQSRRRAIEKRIESTSNFFLKAKFCDLLYEIDKSKVKYARLAIDSYLNLAKINCRSLFIVNLIESLNRALALSLFIKENERIESVVSEYMIHIAKLLEKNEFFAVSKLCEYLIQKKTRLKSIVDFILLEKTIESGLSKLNTPPQETYDLQRIFLDLLLKLVRNDSERLKQIYHQIGDSFFNEGEFVHKNRSAMIAGHFYDKALYKYQAAGASKKFIDDVKKKARKANIDGVKEMEPISLEIKIKGQEVRSILHSYENIEINECIHKLAFDKRIIPSYSAIENEMKGIVGKQIVVPFFFLQDGVKVVEIITSKEKIAFETTIRMKIQAIFMNNYVNHKIYESMEKKNPLFADELFGYIENNNSLVLDASVSGLLKVAIEHYIKGEFVASIHILVFQVEAILRHILKKAGEETFILKNGVSRDLPLGEIIRILVSRNLIDSDFGKYLQVTLNDVSGLNIRNSIGHGRHHIVDFSKEQNEMLLTILIKIIH